MTRSIDERARLPAPFWSLLTDALRDCGWKDGPDGSLFLGRGRVYLKHFNVRFCISSTYTKSLGYRQFVRWSKVHVWLSRSVGGESSFCWLVHGLPRSRPAAAIALASELTRVGKQLGRRLNWEA